MVLYIKQDGSSLAKISNPNNFFIKKTKYSNVCISKEKLCWEGGFINTVSRIDSPCISQLFKDSIHEPTH